MFKCATSTVTVAITAFAEFSCVFLRAESTPGETVSVFLKFFCITLLEFAQTLV